MAGFVLVPLAACLVLSIFLVMERGRVRPSLPVDETGAFFLAPLEADPFVPRPWHELEGYDEEAHPEIPDWAWCGKGDLPPRRRYYRRASVAQQWAAEMDEASASADRDERFAALREAYAADEEIWLQRPDLSGGVTPAYLDWRDRWDESAAMLEAARSGWHWARKQARYAEV